MAAVVDATKCTGCESCVPECPVNAITVQEVAIISEEECIECGRCIDVCPVEAISLPG